VLCTDPGRKIGRVAITRENIIKEEKLSRSGDNERTDLVNRTT
jgi:hypothetical protein